MTDIENHMINGPIDEHEGERDATELEIDSEVTRIIESLDNDDICDMTMNADGDFAIDFWDGVRRLVAMDEVTDAQLAGVMAMLRLELRGQIREQAENQA